MSKILHFGCWNMTGPDFDRTIKMVNSLDLSKYKFLSIGGDNYYKKVCEMKNKKNVKINEYNEQNLIDGFNKLPKNINIIMINGNHDIYDHYYNAPMCSSLIKQNSLNIKNIKKVNDVYHYKLNNSMFIFLDSNLYDLPDKMYIKDTCYAHLDHSKKFLNIKDLRYDQNKKIQNILKEQDCKNLFFVCYHPIIFMRSGYNTRKNAHASANYTIVLYKFTEFLENNKKLLKNKNIYQLCAHNHIYQEIQVIVGKHDDIKITQIVAGTGGAGLYEPPLIDEVNIPPYKIKAKIIKSISSHGAVEIDINTDDDVSFNFIRSDGQTGGNITKTILPKTILQKYLMLKKLIY